jgi:hypothetical protein
MSTVLPDALLDEPPPALLLLPLLLQPATARAAAAAKAAIAGVRLIIFLSFDLNCPAATERADRPVRASKQCDSRRMKLL